MKKILSLILAAGVLSSCSFRLGDFTMLSTRNIDINAPDGHRVDKTRRVKGVDRAHIIVLVPTGQPNMKEATDRAIDDGGYNCEALSDATIRSGWWYVPYIYGQGQIQVEGFPVIKNMPNELPPPLPQQATKTKSGTKKNTAQRWMIRR